MRTRILITAVLFSAAFAFSQGNTILSGRLSADSKLALIEYKDNAVKQNSFQSSPKKSVLLAGILSGVLPGAGEVYVGGTANYIKAGGFFLIEAVSLYYAISFNQRGDAQTNYFQNYADKQWSVVKYAEYLGRNGHPVAIDPNVSLPDWKRVNWASLNAAEDSLGLSHHLSQHGVQQYYELIGKYPQYSPGWNQYVFGSGTSNPNDDYHAVPQQSLDYDKMRGDANSLYKVASRGITFLYVNHLLSILDAIWSSVSFNKDITLNIRYDQVNLVDSIDWVPALHIKYSF
jgi:hypothetical protein